MFFCWVVGTAAVGAGGAGAGADDGAAGAGAVAAGGWDGGGMEAEEDAVAGGSSCLTVTAAVVGGTGEGLEEGG